MMPPTTTYKQGNVVLVPFPFSDTQTTKKRPAIVVSANWYNQSMADCVLVPVTSSIPNSLERDNVLIAGSELLGSGLIKDSIVKTGKLFAIEQALIERNLGVVTNATFVRIMVHIVDVLAINAKLLVGS